MQSLMNANTPAKLGLMGCCIAQILVCSATLYIIRVLGENMIAEIPFDIFRDKRLGRTDYKVYAFFYLNQGKALPTGHAIAKEISSNPDATYDAISRLESFGYIEKVTVGKEKHVKLIKHC
jgi:hypothetical protein